MGKSLTIPRTPQHLWVPYKPFIKCLRFKHRPVPPVRFARISFYVSWKSRSDSQRAIAQWSGSMAWWSYRFPATSIKVLFEALIFWLWANVMIKEDRMQQISARSYRLTVRLRFWQFWIILGEVHRSRTPKSVNLTVNVANYLAGDAESVNPRSLSPAAPTAKYRSILTR